MMQCAARSSGRVMLNDPRWDLASGVRLLATMTASRMWIQFYMRIIRLTEVAMRRIIVLVLLVGTGIGLIARTPPPAPPPAMTAAARAFLDSLTPEQKAVAQFPFDAEERFVWFYTPVPRKGLTLKAMTEPQRKLAMNLLRSGLSEKGYTKAETIRGRSRTCWSRWAAIRPSAIASCITSRSSASPAPRPRGAGATRAITSRRTGPSSTARRWRPRRSSSAPTRPRCGRARRRGCARWRPRRTWRSSCCDRSTRSSRQAALIDPKSPNDILTTNTREAAIQADRGLASSQMTAAQKAALLKLIEEHAGTQTDPIARDRLARVKDVARQRQVCVDGRHRARARATTTACRDRAS